MNKTLWARGAVLGALASLMVACQAPEPPSADSDSLTLLQERALTLNWNNTWSASAMLDTEGPADLSPWADGGTLRMDVKVDNLEQGDLKLMMRCGDDCVRVVDISLGARELEGQGWQSVAVPLACFAQPGDTFSHMTIPFLAEGGGTGQARFANIRFDSATEGTDNTFGCVPPELLSITPAPLAASWALEWWLPRHEEKLQQAAQGDVDLVLIGDSITHGWEDAGQDVWQRHFGHINTLNLGFSGDRTENVLWRFEHGELNGLNPRAAVIMIGTNNAGHRQEPSEMTATGVRAIIDELKARLPETDILLLGIFPRGATDDDHLRRLNHRTNGILETMAEDERVTYLNINDAFLTDDGQLSEAVMPDLLHPNEHGYELWAQAMKPVLLRLLEQ